MGFSYFFKIDRKIFIDIYCPLLQLSVVLKFQINEG